MDVKETCVDPLAWLIDPTKRWLLVIGSHLSASSGVPLPFYQTAWSPSIRELVRYHIFQTHSREAAAALEQELAAGKPPLGLIGDTLKEQDAWLQQQIRQLTPQGPTMYLAELARHGMFEGIVSAAYDDLLPSALSMLQVPHAPCTLERPQARHNELPLLREYDDTLYQDTTAHRLQEARFLRERIGALLQQVDGVWLLGHPPYNTDLFEALQAGLEERPETPVVWMQEKLKMTPSAFGEQPKGQPMLWLHGLGKRASIIETQELSQTLHDIATRRGVTTQRWEESTHSKIGGLLNRTVDVRPVLVYVPGVSLFGEALKKLPRISIKALLGVALLLLLVLFGLHYREYKAFQVQLKKPARSFALAKQQRASGATTLVRLLKAAQTLEVARQALDQVKLTKDPLLVLPQLSAYLKKQRGRMARAIRSFRARQITPQLYRLRTQQLLRDDQRMQALRHIPALIVTRYRPPKRSSKQKKRQRYHRPIIRRYPLSHFDKTQHRVLRSSNAMLLRLLRHRQSVQELQAGRLVFVLDFRDDTTLSAQLFRQVQDTLGRPDAAGAEPTPATSSRATPKALDFDGIRAHLRAGKATLVFKHLDTAGSVERNIARLQELLLQYPKCRTLMTTRHERTSRLLAKQANKWLQLMIRPYTHYQAKSYLRRHTSSLFFEGVMSNSHLRWNWEQPLILAMLLEYDRSVGRPPRGLGALYERLLRRMLSPRTFSTHRKCSVLEYLAYHSLKQGRRSFSISQALRWLKGLTPAIAEKQLQALLREALQQDVLRRHSLGTMGFVEKSFRLLFAARHLHRLRFAERKAFLLQQSTLFMSIYVGVQPKVSRLVKSWLDDFQRVQRRLKKLELHHRWINPLSPSLVHAALAVHDGDVDADQINRLESILFYGLDQAGEYSTLGFKFTNLLLRALDFLSTQGMRYRLLRGLEQDSRLDHLYLRLMARSSSDAYEAAVMRWLQRVRTPRDKRTDRHAYDKQRWARPPSKRGLPDAMSKRTLYSIYNALTTLVQSGSPASLRFVTHFITPDQRRRFRPQEWRKIRKHTIKRMFSNGHWQMVYPLFQRLVRRTPHRWRVLFVQLHKTGSPNAAALLYEIITAPAPELAIYMSLKAKRAAFEKRDKAHARKTRAFLKEGKKLLMHARKVMAMKISKAEKRKRLKHLITFRRRYAMHKQSRPTPTVSKQQWKAAKDSLQHLIYTRHAALRSLTRFPGPIHLPLLKKLLREPRQGELDIRSYGVYGLSLLRRAGTFATLKALIEERMRKPLPKTLPQKWRAEQTGFLTKSLTYIGDARAFALYRKLMALPRWRRDGSMAYWLHYFQLKAVQSYALKQLVCRQQKPDSHTSLISSIANEKTAATRRLLNRLIALATVRDEPDFRRALCGKKLLPYKTLRKRLWLHSLIEAIVSFKEINDLPRLMQWVHHSDFLVAVEAVYALRGIQDPAVTRLMWRRFITGASYKRAALSTLKEPNRKVNELWLMRALYRLYRKEVKYPPNPTRAQRKKLYLKRRARHKKLLQLIRLIGIHGKRRSLRLIMPLQSDTSLARATRDAVIAIAKRSQGLKQWSAGALLDLLPKPKAAPPTSRDLWQKPTTRPTPSSRPTKRL